MNVPDLRSPAVQKLPDAQLAQIISDGKGGNASVQEFAQRGSDSLARGVRSFAASEKIVWTQYAVLLTGDRVDSSEANRLKGGTS